MTPDERRAYDRKYYWDRRRRNAAEMLMITLKELNVFDKNTLSEAMNILPRTAQQRLTLMHRKEQILRIVEWALIDGAYLPRYSLQGKRKLADAPMPKMGNNERCKRYREKNRDELRCNQRLRRSLEKKKSLGLWGI